MFLHEQRRAERRGKFPLKHHAGGTRENEDQKRKGGTRLMFPFIFRRQLKPTVPEKWESNTCRRGWREITCSVEKMGLRPDSTRKNIKKTEEGERELSRPPLESSPYALQAWGKNILPKPRRQCDMPFFKGKASGKRVENKKPSQRGTMHIWALLKTDCRGRRSATQINHRRYGKEKNWEGVPQTGLANSGRGTSRNPPASGVQRKVAAGGLGKRTDAARERKYQRNSTFVSFPKAKGETKFGRKSDAVVPDVKIGEASQKSGTKGCHPLYELVLWREFAALKPCLK